MRLRDLITKLEEIARRAGDGASVVVRFETESERSSFMTDEDVADVGGEVVIRT